MTETNFVVWMRDMERHLGAFSAAELDDLPWREWFDAGVSAEDAARRAISECLDSICVPGLHENF